MNRLVSVRARTTAVAVVVFAGALVLAGIALLSILRNTMIDNVDVALELRVRDVATHVENGSRLQDETAIEDETDGFVQFVRDGVVVASSENIEGEKPVVPPGFGLGTIGVSSVEENDRFRVMATEVSTPDGPVTLVVGTTLENVDETLGTAARILLIGIPSLLGLAGVLTWFAIGRGLRPVEAIRAEVAEIGATDLHRRVPEPRSKDEIGRLAKTMNDMLDRIESGTLRQKQFVSDASHELRTPIAIIRHELEVALLHRDDTDWPMVAEEVLEEDLRMQRLVDDLLWLARHDHENRPVKKALVDLDELVVAHAKRGHVRDGVTIDSSQIGAGQVRGRADDLTRVVQNLLNNAVRHAVSKVALTVMTTDAGRVELWVDDDGPGVATDKRESILERFTRSDDARTRDGGGAGLGLAIVREIVREHHGVLTIGQSAIGGARFVVDLADARSD